MIVSSSGRLELLSITVYSPREEAKREGVKASEDATRAATAAQTLNIVRVRQARCRFFVSIASTKFGLPMGQLVYTLAR